MSQSSDTIRRSTLLAYPVQAAFGRVLPKSKIYEHSGVTTRLRGLFVSQVDQIVWQYKLAPETINLPARPGTPEIQILSIRLKGDALHEDVLRCIDCAVQFPIVFELHNGQGPQAKTQVVAAYKRSSIAERAGDPSRWVLSSYFATDWMPASTPRSPMPVAVDMAHLYSALLHTVIPLPAHPQEDLVDWVRRAELVISKQRDLARMQVWLERERQFNRRVEINATLRRLKSELEKLLG